MPSARDLHVIAVFFNHYRRENPVRNFLRFKGHMQALGVTLHVVELVNGDLDFQVTEPDCDHHTQLRTRDQFFQKENLINIGFRQACRLYPQAQYFAWWDADIEFFAKDVAVKTIEMLNIHAVGQPWGMACALGPDHQPLTYPGRDEAQVARGFGYSYIEGLELTSVTKRYGYEWHTGYAWACRRDVLEAIGGLYEHSIIGSADNHMAWSFIGKVGWGLDTGVSAGFRRDLEAWCKRAADVVAGDVGYVDGLIHHHWHGRRADRKYVDRWKVMVDNAFDPASDLRRDVHGLLRLTGNKPKLQFDLRSYMRGRNDDANTP